MLKLVQFLKIGNAGIIELDRPDALNALNIEMVKLMAEHLKLWEKDKTVGHVIICSSSGKAFCSGGDVRQAVSFIKKDPEGLSAEPYFRAEYSLDVIIATYSKPIISLVNGVVMGGGLGLCRNGSITVVVRQLNVLCRKQQLVYFRTWEQAYFYVWQVFLLV